MGILTGAMGASLAQAQTWVSAVSATPTSTGAVITWSTAVPSDSQVEYGAAAVSYGAVSSISTAKVTAHSMTLAGLTPGTTYHFRVRSSDATGALVVSSDYTLTQPAQPLLTVTPPSLNFGTVALQACSAVQFATLTNSGKSSVTVGPFALTGSSGGDFVWGGAGSCHNGQALAAGASCTHSLKFCPTAAGPRSGADSIPNSASSSPLVVSLSGNGSETATLAVSPTSLSFAAPAGSSAVTPSSLSITNTGGGSLAFTGASDQPWLVLSATSGTAPSTIQVSPSVTSLKAGSYTGHVTFTGGGSAQTATVALTVAASPETPSLTANPPSLDLGTVALQACSAVQITTLTNNGKSAVTIRASALAGSSVGDFAWGGVGSCNSGQTLAPGASCTHSFKFCPTASGIRSGTDSITSSGSSSPTVVALSGTGAASTPVLAVSPASLSFAGQTGSSGVTPSSLSITNTGSGSLTFTGASDQPWLVLSANSGTTPSTLRVSAATANLKAGTYTGHVNLTGGGVTKTVTVALTLTSPQTQHSVALSWKASPNSHVVSYSVYRSSTSGSSYALSASAIGGVSFSDQGVEPATTYYYVVTAVDDQGRESEYSAQVSAVIP